MNILSVNARRTTGRRWTRPERRHPDWCSADHACTAGRGYPAGEHRGVMVWATPYGRLIVTRTLSERGTGALEIRVVTPLPVTNESAARNRATQLTVHVDRVARAIAGRRRAR